MSPVVSFPLQTFIFLSIWLGRNINLILVQVNFLLVRNVRWAVLQVFYFRTWRLCVRVKFLNLAIFFSEFIWEILLCCSSRAQVRLSNLQSLIQSFFMKVLFLLFLIVFQLPHKHSLNHVLIKLRQSLLSQWLRQSNEFPQFNELNDRIFMLNKLQSLQLFIIRVRCRGGWLYQLLPLETQKHSMILLKYDLLEKFLLADRPD